MHWSPLLEVSFKANFDATLFDGTNSVGIGVVVRDHLGCVSAALSQRVNSIHSVETTEELAARWAMVLAGELSLFNVIFEGDCLRIIQALQCSGRCKTLFGHIIEETKRFRCRTLRFCKFQHVRQDGNKLAHSLARKAILFANTDVWVEELSSKLDDVFQSDLP